MAVSIRLVAPADAAELADALAASRSSMAPTEPARAEDYYTEAGQRREIDDQLAAHEQRRMLPCVILDDGAIAGRVNLSQIFYRALCSGILGYWVRHDRTGRGVASAAVAQLVELAFGPWELHRVEAGTLVDNLASQRVLLRNGFVRYGLAPRYLHIAGDWRDHVLFQRLNESSTGGSPACGS